MMSRVLIFTGPTLDEDTIEELLPNAEIYPPVAAGDLLRLPLLPGDLVAIVDGFYFQSASVRHKEILALLQRGVHVWGAGSMGALRAAELVSFGMRGFGAVFQAYCNGEIDGDDEVAVLHTPQDMEYMKLTEALVNIRSACQAAAEEKVVSEEDAQLILRIASELPFFERSYARIWPKVVAAGVPAPLVQTLRTFVRQKRHDRKRADALEMLQALQQPPLEPFHASFQVQETSLLRDWKLEEQGTMLNNQWIADREVLVAYQLFGEDYPQAHRRCLTEQLARIALGACPRSEEANTQPSLSPQDRTQLIARFFATNYGFPLAGELPERARRWLYPHEQNLSCQEQLVLLGVRLWHVARSQGWQEAMIRDLKSGERYHSLARLVYQSRQFNQKLQESNPNVRLERLSPQRVQEWAMQRWQHTAATFDIALLDRGFKSSSAFLQVARAFYLFDKYTGVSQSFLQASTSTAKKDVNGAGDMRHALSRHDHRNVSLK